MAKEQNKRYKTGNEIVTRPREKNSEKQEGSSHDTEDRKRAAARAYVQNQKRIAEQRENKRMRIHAEKTRTPAKLSGFGFTMILVVALTKDIIDVVGAIGNVIIFSFGTSAVSGIAAYNIFGSSFAGFLGAIIPNALKLTGIGTGAVAALNMGLSMTFTLLVFFVSLSLFFTILIYLTFQGVSMTARRLAVVATSFIISIIPLLNWLPETFLMLLVLRHYEKTKAEKHQGEETRKISKGNVSQPLPA